MKWLSVLIIVLFASFHQPTTENPFLYPNVFVQYDSAWTFNKLSLIPIRFRTDPALGFQKNYPKNCISLQQAMQSKKIEVKEIIVNKGSDVSVLVVKNKTGKTVIVNSGEIIAGGKQDRVTAEFSMLPSQKEEQYISVFCAEKGRWDDKAKPFFYHSSVDIPLRKKIDVEHRQTEVWKEIEERFAAGKISGTTYPYVALQKTMQQSDSVYKKFFLNKFYRSDSNFAGFIAVTENRVIACELFALPQYVTVYYESMLSSFIHSVKETDEVVGKNKSFIASFADSLMGNEQTQKIFIQKAGKIDKVQNAIYHLIAYGK